MTDLARSEDATVRPKARLPGLSWTRERIFFGAMVGTLFVLVLWGFAPTLYLRSWMTAPPPSYLDPAQPIWWLFLAHGIAFSAWMALLLFQTLLVDTRHLRLHRTVGRYGYWLIGLTSLTALSVASYAARRGFHGPGDPISFAAASYSSVLCFAIMAWLGLNERRNAQRHKRLMLLATMTAASAGTSRIPIIADQFPAWMDATALLLVPLAIWDVATLRRLAPATIWGGVLVLFVAFAAVPLGETATWHALMNPLFGRGG